MISARRQLALILYYAVAIRLPGRGPLHPVCRWLRQELCRAFVDAAGASFNIAPGVHLGTGAGVRIGDRSGLGRNCRVYGPVEIGREVMVGPEVSFLSENHRFDRLDEPIGWQGKTALAPPRIEDGAWIGLRATVLPGRVVGAGAVVGACSVVTRDVPPLAIVGGNPARVVGDRRGRTDRDLAGAAASPQV